MAKQIVKALAYCHLHSGARERGEVFEATPEEIAVCGGALVPATAEEISAYRARKMTKPPQDRSMGSQAREARG